MFRITRTLNRFVVSHVHNGQPTLDTLHYADTLPEAWVNAFGRASKHSLILRKAVTIEVEDGRMFTVIAYPDTHTFEPSKEDRMYCEVCGGSETDHSV